ncbi:MAG: hypothetical protein ACUVQ8_06100 [Nitrososphaeria archaeon]
MSRKTKSISVDDLRNPPYSLLISYPKIDKDRVKRTIQELKDKNVYTILCEGITQVDGLRVLGKGCTSIVFAANTKYGLSAVKVLRTDADRTTLIHEAEYLKKVNKLGIGPTLYDATDEFLIMELLKGKKIGEYIQELRGEGRARRLKKVIGEIMRQCFVLDSRRIAHCELSNPLKHIVVTTRDRPVILDFESASENKKYSNLTSFTQSFFVGGRLSPKVRKILGIKNHKPIVDTLKEYKQNPNEKTFEKALTILRIKIRRQTNERQT